MITVRFPRSALPQDAEEELNSRRRAMTGCRAQRAGRPNRIELDPGAGPAPSLPASLGSLRFVLFRAASVGRAARRVFPIFCFLPSSCRPTFPTPPPLTSSLSLPRARSAPRMGASPWPVVSFSRFPASRAPASLCLRKSRGGGECLNRWAGSRGDAPAGARSPPIGGRPAAKIKPGVAL